MQIFLPSTNMKSLNEKYKVIQVKIHIFKKEISCQRHSQQDGHEHIQAKGEQKIVKASLEGEKSFNIALLKVQETPAEMQKDFEALDFYQQVRYNTMRVDGSIATVVVMILVLGNFCVDMVSVLVFGCDHAYVRMSR